VHAISRPPAGGGRTVLLLAAAVGLVMTGYGIVYPVLPKRLAQLGAGVDALGLMIMVFALAQFLLAPFMGALADRFGRRPLILVALVGFGAANIALVLAESAEAYVAIRFVEGVVTAGLLPAALAAVGDLAPPERRGHWSGAIMGGYSVGLVLGPTFGGLLYQTWGFAAPFLVSAGLALPAGLLIVTLVPETRPLGPPDERAAPSRPAPGRLLAALPRQRGLLAVLLLLDFLAVFVFAFVEPPMAFYVYDALGFSPIQFGAILGGYGLAMAIGQATTGQLSDRFGRRLPIAFGFMLNVGFSLALVVKPDFGALVAVAVLAGIGGALLTPALSAAYLDIAAEAHRSRLLGLKESAASLGGVAGPLLAALASGWLTPENMFAIGAALPLLAVLLTLAPAGWRRRPVPADEPSGLVA
jgi:DHA1 family multidrug resistance protein-like MFS transporter